MSTIREQKPVSHKPSAFPPNLLKGGAALGAVGASLIDGSAAQAGNKALKEQAEALKAAAAARPAVSQPAAELSGDHYARAKLLLAGGDVPGAMAAFRRVLAEEPRSVDAMNGLGVTYDRMGRHDVARGWYEAALAVAPRDGAVLANLGYSLTLQNEWRQAIPWLQAAARSADPSAVQTARRLLTRVNAALTAERAREPVFAHPVEMALSVPAPETLSPDTPLTTPAWQAPAWQAPARQTSVSQLAQSGPPAIVSAPALVSLQESASKQSARQSPAAVHTGAHIEMAANGEARLVLGEARAPAPALVASLGEAATLVLAPLAPSAGAEVLLASASPEPARAAARAARKPAAAVPMLIMVEAPIAVLTLASTPEITLIPALVATRRQNDALAGAAANAVASYVASSGAGTGASTGDAEPASRQNPAISRPIVRQALARVEATTASAPPAASAAIDIMDFALAPEALTRTSVASAPVLTAAPPQIGPGGPALQRPGNPEANPAWLLHIRRAAPDGRTAPSAPALALTTADTVSARLFDSDDGALNTSAAHLRAPGVDRRSPAARQAAIARLEAVIARVCAA